ncbi:MAG: hypothetical protein ACRCZF_09400, partial [Gemmataceae bacterium]
VVSMSQLIIPPEKQLEILLGIRLWECPPEQKGIVPDYLEQQYARECCAASLGEFESLDTAVLAALLKVAYTDPVAEVRDHCLRSIGQYVTKGMADISTMSAVFWSMAGDQSPKVRCTALERLWEVNQEWGGRLAQKLLLDPDWLVAETARGIVAVA